MALDNRSRVVFAFIFFPALGFVFLFADPLRLQEMKSERKSHMEAFATEPASHWELKQSKTGQI